MIKRELIVNREHTNDYEIVIKEVATRKMTLFGIVIFKNVSTVINNNVNAAVKKTAGFKTVEKTDS